MKKRYGFDYVRYDDLGELDAGDRELMLRAREACGNAYAPYSGFRVGAAARLESGRVIAASNQESGVFPAGMCAERVLLYHHQANFGGDPIAAIAIASSPADRECYPCGMCRQVLSDSESRQGNPIKVIMTGGGSATVVANAKDLLPFTFEL